MPAIQNLQNSLTQLYNEEKALLDVINSGLESTRQLEEQLVKLNDAKIAIALVKDYITKLSEIRQRKI